MEKNEDGKTYIQRRKRIYQYEKCTRKEGCNEQTCGPTCTFYWKVADRLEKYESIGLTPEEIKERFGMK